MARCSFLVARIKRMGITKQLVKIYIAAFISMFSSAFSITMLFPFLPFMVEQLLPGIREESVGKYAGYIASSMFFGRLFGSYIWGAIADHKGRKPVLVISGILVGLSSGIFGFSVHFAMAVATRFLVGLTNGVVGTAKAIISEASDDRNQAFGISLISSAWGLGFVFGPAISGALADPIGQYNLNITNVALHSFLTRFPYSPPCLVNLFLCLLSAAITICLLPETRGLKTNRKRSELTKLEEFQKQHSVDTPEHCSDTTSLASDTNPSREEDETRPLTSADHSETNTNLASDGPTSAGMNSGGEVRTLTSSGTNSSGEVRTLTSSGTNSSDEVRTFTVETDSVGRGCLAGHTSEIEMQRLDSSSHAPPLAHSSEVLSSSSLEVSERNEVSSSTCRTSGVVVVNTGFVSFTSLESEYFPNKEDRTSNNFGDAISSQSRDATEDSVPSCASNDGENEIAEDDNVPLIAEESSVESFVIENCEEGEGGAADDGVVVKTPSRVARIGQSIKKSLLDLKSFLCDRVTLLTLLIYSTFSFAVIGFDETYSLWAYTQPYLGGLGFSLHEIGLSLSVVGALLLPFSLFLFAVLEKYLGSIRVFYVCTSTLVFFVILLPTLHYLIPTGLDPLLWLLLCAVLLVMRVAIVTCFSSCFLLINNSVTFDQLGGVNGLAVSLTSLFRTVSPIFYGGIYSTSLSQSSRALGFPLDHNAIFVVCGIVFLLTVVMATCLPESINRQKIIEDE